MNYSQYTKELYQVMHTVDVEELDAFIQAIIDAQFHRIFICGNGTNFALAQSFSEKVNYGLHIPTYCLGSNPDYVSKIASEIGFKFALSYEFSDQIPDKKDLLVCIDTKENSKNIFTLVKNAQANEVPVVGLSGFGGGELFKQADVNILVGSRSVQQVESTFQIILNYIVDTLREYYNYDE